MHKRCRGLQSVGAGHCAEEDDNDFDFRGVTVLGLLFCSALSHSGPDTIIINNARGTDLTRRITQLTSSPLFSQAMALLK